MKLIIKLIIKLVTAGVGALALMMALGGAVTPAEAAGNTLIVGFYDPVDCKYSNIYSTDIQAAVDALPQPKKIIVCPGSYDPVTIDNKQNMTLIGKGWVGIAPSAAGYTGPLVYVHNSTNITIQGFFVDGNENIGTGGMTAGIVYDEASGKIVKNHVLHIRQSPIGDPTTPASAGYAGIWVGGTLGRKVQIVSNTIDDYETVGIYATGNVNVQISRNLISGVTIPGASNPSQGVLLDAVAAGSVTGNTIENNAYVDFYNLSMGVQIYASSNIKVQKNKLNHVGMGITVYSDGAAGMPANANSNVISSNTLNDTIIGIGVQADDNSNTTAADPHADFNRITGNKVISPTLYAMFGISIEEIQDDPLVTTFTASAYKNVISGNALYGFCECNAIDPGPVSTVMGRNKVGLPPAGAAAPPAAKAPGLDMSAIPHHLPYVDWN